MFPSIQLELVTVDISQEQFDALVIFAFNRECQKSCVS